MEGSEMNAKYADLLTSQKNMIFHILVSAGLSAAHFEWIRDGKGYSSSPCPVLQHISGLYYFLFIAPDRIDKSWHYKCSPGRQTPVESDLVRGWEDISTRVIIWAEDLRLELEEPDLWASVSRVSLEDMRPFSDENSAFSQEEVSAIGSRLSQLRRYLIDESHSTPDLRERLDSILGAIDRLEAQARAGVGRVDWLNHLVGLSINIIVAGSFAPEKATEFLGFVRSLFSNGLRILLG